MQALSLGAQIHALLGDLDESLRLFDQALEMSALVDELDIVSLTALIRAQTLVDAHRYDEARLALEQIVARYRDEPDEEIRETVDEALDALSRLGSL